MNILASDTWYNNICCDGFKSSSEEHVGNITGVFLYAHYVRMIHSVDFVSYDSWLSVSILQCKARDLKGFSPSAKTNMCFLKHIP